jgi:hypothetical protein
MRTTRVLLALGVFAAVVGCSAHEDADVGQSQEAIANLTFGYPTVGASWGVFGSGVKAVNRFALTEAGSISKLSIYADGNGGPTGTGVMKGVVYADAGGQPGALLATSNEVSIASGAAAGWRDLVFGAPVSLSAGNYFVGVLVGGTANVIRETYDVQTGIMRYNADAYADGASNPYGTATTFNNKMSLYATYTTAAKTFGYATVGASWGVFGSGIKAVNRFPLTEAGRVNKLSIYVDGNGGPSGTGMMKGIIYADAGGQPGALLATSNEISITAGAAGGWRDLVFGSPVSLSAGRYFLGVLVGGTGNVIRETYDAETGIMRYDADAYADGASNSYGAATTFNNKMSLYASYSGGTTGAPAVTHSPSSLSFGDVAVGSVSAARTLTLTNTGSDNLVISATTLSGNFAWGAANPTACTVGRSYAPGASCTMAVSFAPQSAGAASGALTVTDNAPNSPQTISLSGTGTTGPSNGANLLFKSGFEGDVSLGAPYNISATNAWQDILGSDPTTGFSFTTGRVFGNKFTIQLLSGGGVLSDVIQNSIVPMTGHTGETTRALRLDLKQKVNGNSQDQFMINVTQSPQEFYISEWIRYPADIAQRLGNGGWVLGPPEWKSNGDFRIVYTVNGTSNGALCWEVKWDTNANGSVPLQTFYNQFNFNVPVPRGEWFRVETYTRRGHGTDGRAWLKVNGQLVFDHTGTTIGPNAAPINRLFVSGAYANFPVQMHVDDFEIWDRVPY